MNKSLIECFETDYKLAIQQMFTRIYSSAKKWDDKDLPLLRMEYMIDDLRDVYKVHSN